MDLKNKENYLKTILINANELGEIAPSVLSRKLGVSIPTVNSMAKRLQDFGWIKYEKYKPLKLTEEGRKTAALIIRRHRITEMFLVEKMEIGWEYVHDIAEEMEHINSDLLFKRMDEMLGHPETDPHGTPIPDRNGNLPVADYIPMADLEPGQKAKLCSIHKSSSEFLVFLNKKEISLKTEFQILNKEPFDQSMEVSYVGHKSEVFSQQICERLYVKKI